MDKWVGMCAESSRVDKKTGGNREGWGNDEQGGDECSKLGW